jgi:hypothetical protein
MNTNALFQKAQPKNLKKLLVAPLFAALLGVTAAVAQPWVGSGPGTATVISDGTVFNPQFQYSLNGGTHSDQTWAFHTTAAADGAVTLPYCWRGFHAFFQVTTHLQAYVTHNGVTTFTSLVNDGPVDCCTPPSAGFHYTGSVTLNVLAGDTYGFQFGGENFDSDERLLGTFTLFSTSAPTADAGGPYSIAVGTTSVQLDGTGSSDSDNDPPLRYLWTTDCANATIDNPTNAMPILTFNPGGACGQSCTVTLTVDDGCDTGTNSATVTFTTINVDIYSGFTPSGGGAPYSGLAGSFTVGDVKFATTTGFDWHPFGLFEFGANVFGYLNVAASGTYTFTLDSDDGSLLFIDGIQVVDNGDPHGPQTASGSATLTAGTHCFEIQFFECCGGPSGLDLILPAGVTYGCQPTKCPLSLGYWKNHADLWPVSTLMLGTVSYTKAQLLAILRTSPGTGRKADASLILAQQLIAAKLSLANGSDACAIGTTIAAADALIGGRTIPITPKISPTSAEGQQMVSLASMLEQYNTGLLTPGCAP